MFILVAYDSTDDQRRTRLHRTLKNFGVPVQYSVFECQLRAADFIRLKIAVEKIVEPGSDAVRYYRLCESCRRHVETIPSDTFSEDENSLVV